MQSTSTPPPPPPPAHPLQTPPPPAKLGPTVRAPLESGCPASVRLFHPQIFVACLYVCPPRQPPRGHLIGEDLVGVGMVGVELGMGLVAMTTVKTEVGNWSCRRRGSKIESVASKHWSSGRSQGAIAECCISTKIRTIHVLFPSHPAPETPLHMLPFKRQAPSIAHNTGAAAAAANDDDRSASPTESTCPPHSPPYPSARASRPSWAHRHPLPPQTH